MAILSEFLIGAAQTTSRDYSKEHARPTRDWVIDGVIYQIFPRVFSAEGNFKGVTAQLDRLKDLGVNILWLMPVHPVGRERAKGTYGSPYAVKDYYAINPDYGTRDDLKRLISEAHRRNMKVIIDIVANHTAWDSVLMKMPEMYKHDANGKIISPVPDWTDVAGLNYENPQTRAYMTEMLKYWIREFNLDGFRCDVAGMVPTSFWEQARTELDKIKPDIVMLAEWDSPDLLAKSFDLDYSWKLHSKLTDVLQGLKPANELRAAWEDERAKFPQGSLHMRFSDNHDERRAIARFGERGALAASVLMFTLDGVPLVYNGMEAGDTAESGAPALFEKIPILWQIAERRPEFPKFYKQIIALRATHPALRRGEVEWLKNSDEAHVVTFARRDATEEIVVAINFSSQPFNGFVAEEMNAGFADVTPDVSMPLPPDAPASEIATRHKSRVLLPAFMLDAWSYKIYRRALR
ncbi:MAG: alpha-amylase family glycosyl hydrolase [Pyrinomonadaceae bacterium]